MGEGYWLSWTAPEGKVARADLDGLWVESNEPVMCRTWWFASVLAAKIAYANEGLTDRVGNAAKLVDSSNGSGVEINDWTFMVTEAR